MAINFGRLPNTGKAETPNFVAAANADGIAAQRAKAQSNALRSQNMIAAAKLYNAGMGERSPIADKLFEAETPADTTNVYDGMTGEPDTVDINGDGAETANPLAEGNALEATELGTNPQTIATPLAQDTALEATELGANTAATELGGEVAAIAAEEAAAAEALEAQQAASAAASTSSAAGSSTPWGALLMAIKANEDGAIAAGRRSSDDAEYRKDLITGKVWQQDGEALGDKVGGPLGKGIQYGSAMGNPEGAWETAVKNPVSKVLRDPLNPFKWFGL